MSRGILKTVGMIAGAVALIGSAVLTAGGTAFAATALGGALGGAGGIVAISGLVAGVANIGAQLLTKPPPVQGSVSQIMIAPDAPQPYVMGEGHFGGVLRYDQGYGPEIDDIPNPYRFMAVVYSGGGPVQSISPRIQFASVSSWYSGYLWTDTQLGTCPEGGALAPHYSGSAWGASAKLSGQAAIGWSFRFDKDGKRFASGIPLTGAYGQWVKVYDPRLDSTQPGGSGPHRLGNESTYAFSRNPALHAGTYAFGRYQNGKRTMGMGLPADGIDWATVAAWANVCDFNAWTMFGVVFEPGDRWANLKDICFAGGGEPVAGGKLTFKYSAPVVALDTVTVDDLTGDARSVTGMQSFRDRKNTIVPKYRSPSHNWEMVDAEAIVNATFLAEDGEEKREVWPFNFVTTIDQAAELAAYRMFDSRELPFTITCKPHMRLYRPGDCLHVTDPELGIDGPAIIQRRQIDPATMKVTFEMLSETTAKHAYCLGRTGVAPPTPALGQTAQERDEAASGGNEPSGYARAMIDLSRVTDADPADGLMQATDDTITIEEHSRTYPDRTVTVLGGTLAVDDQGDPLVASTSASPFDSYYHVYYDDPERAGGTVTYMATTDETIASNNVTYPRRHYVGTIAMDVVGGTGTSSGGSNVPPGWDPDVFCVSDDTPIHLADASTAPARDLTVGTMLYTQHEGTLEWGYFPVSAISFADAPVYACRFGDRIIRATADHRFATNGEWVRAADIGQPDGNARVAKITVAEAHTYVSAGILSHNIKAD